MEDCSLEKSRMSLLQYILVLFNRIYIKRVHWRSSLVSVYVSPDEVNGKVQETLAFISNIKTRQ